MVSPNLQAEQQHLLNTIAQIRGSGDVAPAYCWLTISTVTKGGRTYEYARLVIEKPGSKPKISSLGRLGNERHRHWKTAIARRDAIARRRVVSIDPRSVIYEWLTEDWRAIAYQGLATH